MKSLKPERNNLVPFQAMVRSRFWKSPFSIDWMFSASHDDQASKAAKSGFCSSSWREELGSHLLQLQWTGKWGLFFVNFRILKMYFPVDWKPILQIENSVCYFHWLPCWLTTSSQMTRPLLGSAFDSAAKLAQAVPNAALTAAASPQVPTKTTDNTHLSLLFLCCCRCRLWPFRDNR